MTRDASLAGEKCGMPEVDARFGWRREKNKAIFAALSCYSFSLRSSANCDETPLFAAHVSFEQSTHVLYLSFD